MSTPATNTDGNHISNHPDYTPMVVKAGVVATIVIIVGLASFMTWGWRWFLARPRPLPRRVRDSLPVRPFSAEERLIGCPICLDDFTAGEQVQQLPGCGHRFHVACVGRWFNTNSTCPFCRQKVLAYVAREGIQMQARGDAEAGGEAS